MMKKSLLLISAFLMALCSYGQLTEANVLLFMQFEDNTDVTPSSVTLERNTLVSDNITALTYTDGKFGKAGIFDSIAFMTSGLNFNPMNDFTMSCWYYVLEALPEKTDGHTIIHQHDDGENTGRIHLEILGAGNNWSTFTSGNRITDTNYADTAKAEQWYHAAVVKNNSEDSLKLFINGVQVAQRTISSGTNETNTQQVTIGGRKQIANAGAMRKNLCKGYIDDLLIANVAVSANEIKNIMNFGVKAVLDGDVSTSEIAANAVSIANLGNGVFQVKNVSNATYNVFDNAGRLIQNGRLGVDGTINLNNATKGVYIMQLNANGNTVTEKLLVY